MIRKRRIVLPLLVSLAVVAAAVLVSACGYESDAKDVVEGEPVALGDLQYNVIFSRFLNPNDNEDSAYLVGQRELPPGKTYFGVFLEVKNDSNEAHELADSFTIVDADGIEFEAIPSESLYAFPAGGELEAQEQMPILDSTPEQGPIQGSLVLFELTDAASEARPLILEVPGPEGPAEVTLDL